LSEHARVPPAMLWHRTEEPRDAAAQRQYLTPFEEKCLVDYTLLHHILLNSLDLECEPEPLV
jgi:hypothetical protein